MKILKLCMTHKLRKLDILKVDIWMNKSGLVLENDNHPKYGLR